LETFQCFTVLARQGLYRAEEAVADEPVGRVVLPVGDLHNLARQNERRLHLRRVPRGHAKAVEHREALQIGPNAGVNRPLRVGPGRDRFRRIEALKLLQRVAAGDLGRQFKRLPVRPIAQPWDQREAGIDWRVASALAERDSASSAALSQ